MRRVGQAILTLCVLLTVLSGCVGTAELSAEERARLDSLDATGVVRAYFESGDQEVELYLSPPEERDLRGQSNYVADNEREAGVEDLVIEGGESADWPLGQHADYGDQRMFVVSYTSLRRNSIGEPPGGRMFFVYTGRSPVDGSWKVIGVGTGP